MKSYYFVAVFLVGVFALSACGPSGSAPTSTPDLNLALTVVAQTMQAQNPAQGVQPPSSGAGSYQPVENSICTSVQQSLQPLYPTANFTVSIQPFTDVNGVSGTACIISSFGTGNDFVDGVGSVETIGTTLPGYIQDAMYSASGPTGQTSGYRNGNSLAVVSVSWEPSPSANCPADQPIVTCNIQPADMLYTVSVSMASTGSPAPSSAPTAVPPVAPATAAPTVNANPCDKAEFVADVTVPDGTTFSRGDNFDKTWKLRNIGTCTWNTGYFIQYENGPLQPKNKKINLSTNVTPSQSVDVTSSYNVDLDPGTYRTTWSLRNASGVIVPFSNTSNNVFYTEIKAKASSAATSVAPAAATSYQPVENSVCTSVQQSLPPLYPTANFTASIQPFTDMNGVSGSACVISSFGTGDDFVGDVGDVVGTIGTTLPGYIQDAMYAAGGPTGQVAGYRNGNSLAVVSVGWEPSPSANCPADQPIASCNLLPGDKMYTVSIYMAVK